MHDMRDPAANAQSGHHTRDSELEIECVTHFRRTFQGVSAKFIMVVPHLRQPMDAPAPQPGSY